ncbi:hypothetical protein NL676_005528 [Syzygium grande]|nr:hypothetical protein NL676_005528 [Syzygium grande]
MVNARIRKTIHATQAKVGYMGPPTNLNYNHEHLGTGPQTRTELAEGRHPFCLTLKNAKNQPIIVGAGLFEREDLDAIFSASETMAKNGNVSVRGIMEIEVYIVPMSFFQHPPSAKRKVHMKFVQRTLPAVPTVGDARADWKIICALSEVTGVQLP